MVTSDVSVFLGISQKVPQMRSARWTEEIYEQLYTSRLTQAIRWAQLFHFPVFYNACTIIVADFKISTARTVNKFFQWHYAYSKIIL